jgi:Domain of unknown function (DUF4340)
MNSNAILVAGVLAVIVTIAGVYALLAPSSSQSAAQQLLNVRASTVVQMTMHHDDGRVEHVTRDGSRWLYSLEGNPATWPVNNNNINGALRNLAELAAPPNRGAAKEADGESVVLTIDDGTTVDIQFGTSRVGGSVAMAVADGPSAFVEDSIRAMLFEPGPSIWRDPRALPGVGSAASQIRLVNGNEEITLARIQNSWQLTRPIAHRADQEAVKELLRTIMALPAGTFSDELKNLDAVQAALQEPVLGVGVAQDSRQVDASGEISVQRARQMLWLSPLPDSENQYAARNVTYDTLMTLNGKDLESLFAMSATDLLDRTACGSLLVDVAGLEFDGPGGYWRFTSTIDGWIAQEGTPSLDAPAIDMLIGFLTDAPATSVAIAPLPTLESWADVTLLNLSQEPLETVTIGIDAQGVMYAAIPTLDGQVVVLGYEQSMPSLLARFLNKS